MLSSGNLCPGSLRSLGTVATPGGPMGVPRRSQRVPKDGQAAQKGSQETPRQFATKISKLAQAFDKSWNEGPQNSNASTMFFWKGLKIHGFLMILHVRECPGGGESRPRITSLIHARTPYCKHCLRNKHTVSLKFKVHQHLRNQGAWRFDQVRL